MFTPSDFLLAPADFANVIRAPGVVLTLAFAAILFGYFSAASVFA